MDKFFKLKLRGNFLKEVEYEDGRIVMHIFNYKDYSKVKKEIGEDKSAIYIFNTKKGNYDYYIGQTSKGINRLSNHKMKEFFETAIVYYFTFYKEPSKNRLDAMESKLINIINDIGYATIQNKNSGNNLKFDSWDEQYVSEHLQEINTLLKVVELNLSDSDSIEDFKSDIKKIEKESNIENNKFKIIDFYDETFYIKRENEIDAVIKSIKSDNGNIWSLEKDSKVKIWDFWNKYKNNPKTTNYKFVKKSLDFVDEDGIVIKDIFSSSVSSISALVVGTATSNGWTCIQNKNGKTPNDLFRKKIN